MITNWVAPQNFYGTFAEKFCGGTGTINSIRLCVCPYKMIVADGDPQLPQTQPTCPPLRQKGERFKRTAI